ncbi:hypothetical protein PG993_011603 [Apiospora rasikravindrae]|uniref:Uncharacterized protein n=1 Tax=Apiospora rasikravindrae TaxID=990691 RepID=A0ABR1S037_9PEZI
MAKNIDYFGFDNPAESTAKPVPKDVDYFNFPEPKGTGESSTGKKQIPPEDLPAHVENMTNAIEEAKAKFASEPLSVTITDLVELYGNYVNMIANLIEERNRQAKLAEGVIPDLPPSLDYAGLIQESFGVDVDGVDVDEADKTVLDEHKAKATEEHERYIGLIDRTMPGLQEFDQLFDEIAKTGALNTGQSEWLPQLRAVYKHLSKPMFSHDEANEAFGEHMSKISKFLKDNRLSQTDAWEGGDLKPAADFDAIFEEFKALPTQPEELKNDTQRKELLRSSAHLLRSACDELQVAWEAVDIEWAELVDPAKRPTYTVMDWKSRTFQWGRETGRSRDFLPGIMRVKEELGYRPWNDPHRAKAPNPPSRKAGGNAKRPAPDGEGPHDESPAPKRPKAAAAARPKRPVKAAEGETDPATIRFQQTREADSDIQYLESWTQAEGPGQETRQGLEGLLSSTPMLEPYKPETAKPYRRDFQNIVRALKPLRDRVYRVTITQPNLGAELADAAARVRLEVLSLRGRRDNKSLKAQRLAAFRLVYLRALIVRRETDLAAREDPPPGPGMDEQRARRFEDWIEHERAWNEADVVGADRLKATSSRAAYDERVRRRTASIELWTQRITELRAEDVEEIVEEIEPEDPKTDEHKTTTGETEVVVDPTSTEVETTETEKVSEEVPAAPELTKTARHQLETRYPGTILANFPRRYQDGRRMDSIYLNTSDSRSLSGEDVFAQGGPPGYETMPTETTWEKLQYMIVLTHWRFLKAFEIGL